MAFGIFISVDDSFNVLSPNGRSCTTLALVMNSKKWLSFSSGSLLHRGSVIGKVIGCDR